MFDGRGGCVRALLQKFKLGHPRPSSWLLFSVVHCVGVCSVLGGRHFHFLPLLFCAAAFQCSGSLSLLGVARVRGSVPVRLLGRGCYGLWGQGLVFWECVALRGCSKFSLEQSASLVLSVSGGWVGLGGAHP